MQTTLQLLREMETTLVVLGVSLSLLLVGQVLTIVSLIVRKK